MKHAAPHHTQMSHMNAQHGHGHSAPQNLHAKAAKGGKQHAGMQQDWLAAGPIGGLAAPAYGAGYAGAFAGPAYGAGFGYAATPAYGPANRAEAGVAQYDDFAAFRAGARSDWEGMVGAQDTAAAAEYATRSDAAWKLGNEDSAAALKARKAQYLAWANADNDSVDAAND